jgi:hypothetical protein
MLSEGWQSPLLEQLQALLEPDDDSVALVLFGSLCASPIAIDWWSDVDVMFVTKDGARDRFFPEPFWLEAFGKLYTWERSSYERNGVIRAVFADLRRIDVVVVEEHVVADIVNWASQPLHGPRRTIFSRSPVVDAAIASVPERPPPARPQTPKQFEETCRAFWFEAHIALKKAVRGDLLIAAHLALGLVRTCMVVSMLARDRDAGTRYHREGGTGNAAVAALSPAARPFTFAGIVSTVERAAVSFDALARAQSVSYESGLNELLQFVHAARAAAGN